ncbi:MAG: T9SS type A sorting domain-containing protein [Chitinophagaceae bacterium]|nr:T9SS type A sorting domain-containing protein [Chitinophagaceae bacterium]
MKIITPVILILLFFNSLSQTSPCLYGLSSHNAILTNGASPGSFSTGDFNSDGYLDFVFANGTGSISVMQGDVNGNFTVSNIYTVSLYAGGGDGIHDLVTTDFNGDGKLDLAFPMYATGYYTMFGNGNGTFGPAINHTLTPGALNVISSDFNNDNKPDLAFAIQGNSSCLSIAMNSGSGNFLPTFTLAVGPDPVDFKALDFNNDGKTDLVTSNSGTNQLFFVTGNGNGTFAPSFSMSMPGSPCSVIAEDLNGDSFVDLAVALEGQSVVSILSGNGSGIFTVSSTYSVGNHPREIRAADLNNDGSMDLVTLNLMNQTLSVLISSGSGTFSQAINYQSSNLTHAIAIGDFNNDSKKDILVGLNLILGYGNMVYLKGNGNGTFISPRSYYAGFSPGEMTSNDFNSDGFPDIAVTNDSATLPYSVTIAILMNLGNGTFGPPTIMNLGSRPGGITSADYNNDGKIDIAVTLANNTTKILLNNGSGIFNTQTSFSSGTFGCQNLISVDYNADGNMDLAFSNNINNSINLYVNNGNASFSSGGGFSCIGATSIISDDFNGDNIPDFAYLGAQLWVSIATAPGMYNSAINLPIPSYVQYSSTREYIVSGDFNNDGKKDILAPGYLLLASQAGGFNSGIPYPLSGNANAHKLVTDINNDSNPDVILGLGFANYICILLGDGTGNLIYNSTYPLSSYDLAAGDFNADGLVDVVGSGGGQHSGLGSGYGVTPGGSLHNGGVSLLLNTAQQVPLTITSPSIVCANNPFILSVSGANTYSWCTGAQTNTISAVQNVATTYSVLGKTQGGCAGIAQKTVDVGLINLSVTQSKYSMCNGDTVTISASGALTYTWSNSTSNTSSLVLSPTTTQIFTVSGSNSIQCTSAKTITVEVVQCNYAGVETNEIDDKSFYIYPNPSNEAVILSINKSLFLHKTKLVLFNLAGVMVKKVIIDKSHTSIDIGNLAPGVYMYQIIDNGIQAKTGKLIIQ